MNKTILPTAENLDHKWYVIDAADQRLGRLATE
ncbi:MAG: 50S ribosomal protein L13, partial [Microcystaceae cyanobacterium]